MRSRSTRIYEIEDQVAQIVVDLELYSYYQLLEVDAAASSAIVAYNYNLAAEKWREVRQRSDCPGSLVQNLGVLLDRLEEAQQVLADPALRAEYDRGLDDGNTRLASVVAARAERRRALEPVRRPDHELQREVEREMAKLHRQLDERLIHAPEDTTADAPSEGIEESLVEQESQKLESELAGYGVKVGLEHAPEEELAPIPIDQEYLEEASEALQVKLAVEHAVSLQETGEPEDAALDAAGAAALVDGIRDELAALGVSETEQVEAEDLPVDAQTLDRLLAQERAAVVKLGVETAVQRDEELHERDVDRATVERLAAGLEQDLKKMGVAYEAPLQRTPTGPQRPPPKSSLGAPSVASPGYEEDVVPVIPFEDDVPPSPKK